MTRWKPWLAVALLISGPLVGAGLMHRVKINISPSLPYGLYRVHDRPTSLSRGLLVVFPVPASMRVLHGDIPLLKPVVAVAGDVVCRRGDRLIIPRTSVSGVKIPNGAGKRLQHDDDYGPIYEVWRGLPLPRVLPPETCLTMARDQAFLATKTPYSMDSRYYGPVAMDDMTATATPLLIYGTADATTHR